MLRREFLQVSACALAGGMTTGAASGAVNPGIEWGIYNRPWGGERWDVQIDAVMKSGFKNIGLMSNNDENVVPIRPDHADADARRWKDWLEGKGLRAVSAYFTPDMKIKPVIAALQAQKAQITAYQQLGMRYLLLGGVGREELLEPWYEYVRYMADRAEQIGLELHVKPHGGITPNGAALAEVVAHIGRDCVKASFDPGNIIYYEGLDPVKELQDCVQYVGSVCIKDCIRTSADDRTVNVTPGDGMVDFKGVFDVLMAQNFKGSCVIECLGGTTVQEKIHEAHRAMRFLSQFGPWNG